MTLDGKTPDLGKLILELQLILGEKSLLTAPQREKLIEHVDTLEKQFCHQTTKEQKNTLHNILKALEEIQSSTDKRIATLSFLDNVAPRA